MNKQSYRERRELREIGGEIKGGEMDYPGFEVGETPAISPECFPHSATGIPRRYTQR